MGEVLSFKSRKRREALKAPAAKVTTHALMPYQEATRVKKRRLGSVASRKALAAIEKDSWTVSTCLRWLRAVALNWHDPRALEELMTEFERPGEMWATFKTVEEIEAVLAMIEQVLALYRRRFPLRVVPHGQ